MKKRKRIKYLLGWAGGIALLFVGVLLVHIVIMVRKMPVLAFPTVQMARIDFTQWVDSSDAVRIQDQVRAQKGVKSTYFNQPAHILIYTYDNRVNNSQAIYQHTIPSSGYAAERHLVSQEDLKQGCPVMNDHSFYGKITAIIAKVVK